LVTAVSEMSMEKGKASSFRGMKWEKIQYKTILSRKKYLAMTVGEKAFGFTHFRALTKIVAVIVQCFTFAKHKSPDPSTSPCDKDSDNIFMSICVTFSPMFTDSFKSFNSIEEDGLQVVQSQLVPYPVKSGHNFCNHLKHPILDFLLQHSK
jgi:hypothetical protein